MAELFKTQIEINNETGAQFSECRTWRYALWRHWDWQGHGNCVAFIGLNPSTADETADDPTIRRCIGFAKSWGYGGIYMLNLYAFRATQPADMVAAEDPVGPGNLEALSYYRTRVGLIVAAWGSLQTRWRPRVGWKSQIARSLDAIGRPVQCLGRNADGEPKHPLYLKKDLRPELYWSRLETEAAVRQTNEADSGSSV